MAPSKTKANPDNTCRYCLYFQPPPGRPHVGCGNCVLHKEWIGSASRTTCSEMSNSRLQTGIYQLLGPARGEWRYVRRTKKVRTRLFLVKGGGGKRNFKNNELSGLVP